MIFLKQKKQCHNERNKIFLETSDRAQKIWQRVQSVDSNHPYLLTKKIKGHEAKQFKSMLVIPLHDENRKIWSLQFISKEGKKFFLKKGRKKGLYCRLGNAKSDILYLCEGYATACTIYEATQKCILVAFDAGNLIHVSKQLQALYPHKEIVICADNDQFSTINTGLTKANEAAKRINAKVVVPVFNCLDSMPTDFNDLSRLEGLTKVQEQLNINKLNSLLSESASTNFSVDNTGVFFSQLMDLANAIPH